MLGSRTDLHIFEAGSVNGTRYCNEILLPYVRLLRGAMSLQFLFMDDNAPCHRTVAAEQLLESEDIERMDWPARSPDLNPIEHVWDFLGRRLAARTLPPVMIRELRLALQDEWAAMPQQLIDTLILSMGRRCETCLAVREIISPTKDRMFLAGHPSQGCFGLQSHCAPCYFFNQASFYPSDFSFRRSRKISISAERRGRADRKTNQEIKRYLDAFIRGRSIGKLEEGRSVTSVAAEFGIAHSIVSRLWRQFQTTGTAIRGFSSGRPRGTTPADDRRRSLWCREHRNWRDIEWGRVLFTDESRFSLSSGSHRILIWRERGSRNHPSNIIERDRYGGHGVLVWGGIKLGSRTDLHIFDIGSVNGTRCCNEILLPYVRLFRGAMCLQFLFMDDNAPCHLTVAAEQILESEDIERMDWPSRSPDLNPIEHVWDFPGRRLAARTLPPVTIRELRLALQDEWAAMPQQLIDTLILSMGRRCETCLDVRGDHFPY
ncbi:transposable element Tcb2 transposase [Trichonephila clavipes]|nr:transposable element Tcb2 transposase [Trichonephila clavipes]